MQTLLDILAAAVTWVVVIAKLGAVQRRWTADRLVFDSWAFIFFFAVGLTFQIDAVYVSLDAWTGVPNLSWLLFAIAIALALYFASSFGYSLLKAPNPKWMPISLLVASSLFVIIFPIGIANSPEWPCTAHNIPRTVFDWAFLGTECAYGIGMGLFAATAFVRNHRAEQNTLLRLRWGVLFAAAVSGITLYLSKAILITFGYLVPSAPSLVGLERLVVSARWATCLIWPLSILSNKTWLALLKPFSWVNKQVTLKRLSKTKSELKRALHSLWPSVATIDHNPTLWQRLSNPDFHIYRSVISILDSGRLLNLCLECPETNQFDDALDLAGAVDVRSISTSKPDSEDAAPITEYQELIRAYSR